ncbi:unnamed protein product [Lupinus luteus]|uniref:Uncharacterized protein n=1 Tax=Lupinus luteus TaxID=3873 RepID=A0AAV1VRU8_LUPLU
MEETTAAIMAALSTLTPSHLSNLTNTIFSATHHHHRRLTFLLSSPTLFSLTLHHLNTLSLPQKTLLIARHLLSSLHHLIQHLTPPPPPPPPFSTAIRQRGLDAVLLLLLFCDTNKHNPEPFDAPFSEWRVNMCKHYSHTLLKLSCSSVTPIAACVGTDTILIPYIEMVARCWRMVDALGCCGGGGKEEVAAAASTVIGLPAVEVQATV